MFCESQWKSNSEGHHLSASFHGIFTPSGNNSIAIHSIIMRRLLILDRYLPLSLGILPSTTVPTPNSMVYTNTHGPIPPNIELSNSFSENGHDFRNRKILAAYPRLSLVSLGYKIPLWELDSLSSFFIPLHPSSPHAPFKTVQMHPKTNTKIVATLEKWRGELKIIHTCLNAHKKPTIKVKDLNSMGFQVSTLELETANLNSTFFVPLPKSSLSPSPCALPDHTLFPTPKDKKAKKAFELGKYFTGTVLLVHFLMSLLGLKTSVPIAQVEYVSSPLLHTLLRLLLRVCANCAVATVTNSTKTPSGSQPQAPANTKSAKSSPFARESLISSSPWRPTAKRPIRPSPCPSWSRWSPSCGQPWPSKSSRRSTSESDLASMSTPTWSARYVPSLA